MGENLPSYHKLYDCSNPCERFNAILDCLSGYLDSPFGSLFNLSGNLNCPPCFLDCSSIVQDRTSDSLDCMSFNPNSLNDYSDCMPGCLNQSYLAVWTVGFTSVHSLTGCPDCLNGLFKYLDDLLGFPDCLLTYRDKIR